MNIKFDTAVTTTIKVIQITAPPAFTIFRTINTPGSDSDGLVSSNVSVGFPLTFEVNNFRTTGILARVVKHTNIFAKSVKKPDSSEPLLIVYLTYLPKTILVTDAPLRAEFRRNLVAIMLMVNKGNTRPVNFYDDNVYLSPLLPCPLNSKTTESEVTFIITGMSGINPVPVTRVLVRKIEITATMILVYIYNGCNPNTWISD